MKLGGRIMGVALAGGGERRLKIAKLYLIHV